MTEMLDMDDHDHSLNLKELSLFRDGYIMVIYQLQYYKFLSLYDF